MTDSFVPFSPGGPPVSPPREAFRMTVLSQPAGAVPFVPSQPALSHDCPAPGQGSRAEEPEVTVERDGDRVSRIRVRCTCGHVLELNLAY